MPIEIKELHIKVNVRGKGEEDNTSTIEGDEAPEIDREELIAECVEQVLEIIKMKVER